MKRIILFVLVLALTGCPGGGGGFQFGGAQPQSPEVQSGSQGVIVSFLPNAPPAVVPDNSFFKIIADVENLGSHDVSGAFLSLTTNERYAALETESVLPFQLRGRTYEFGPGDKIFLEFDAVSQPLVQEDLVITTPITATWCYPYETHAYANICLDTDIYGIRQVVKPCQMQPVGLPGGQGGPVGITRIEPFVTPPQRGERDDLVIPSFKIYFENFGTGLIINKDRVREACTLLTDYNQESPLFDVFNAQVYMGDYPLDCGEKGRSLIRYKAGDTYITCTLKKGLETRRGAFTTPIRVDIEYGYRESTATQVTLENR